MNKITYMEDKMGKYIMALDQGTTSSRTILFDKGGNIICQANKEFEQIFPKAGWVEHNPEEIWMTQVLTMGEVMREAGMTELTLKAIGITNQKRNNRCVGQKHWETNLQCNCLAV